MYVVAWLWQDPLNELTASTETLQGRLVHVGKTVTDLQILGYKLHQNASGGRAPPGPVGKAMAYPKPIIVITGRRGRERGRKGLEIGNEGKG